MTGTAAYPVPWRAVFALSPHIAHGTKASVHEFSLAFVELQRGTRVKGLEHLAQSRRFICAANHYQRKGLWIAHPAAMITQTIREHFKLDDPVMHWIVTGNWPPLKIGKLRLPSPGDILLSRVAAALSCFAVPFQGSDAGATAKSLLKLIRTVPSLDRPIGLFPEGVSGKAGSIAPALPGVDRLLRHLAAKGLPVQPVGIGESPELTIRFGPALSTAEIRKAKDPGELVMKAIGELA